MCMKMYYLVIQKLYYILVQLTSEVVIIISIDEFQDNIYIYIYIYIYI